MLALIAIFAAFLVPFVLVRGRFRPLVAWLVSCLVVPAFVLFVEVALPYSVGGASMWPIALAFGAVCSAAAGGVGTLIAARLAKSTQRPT